MDKQDRLIPRPHYIDQIIDVIDRGMIIILIGQRRVGKSYILLQLERDLKLANPSSNIIYINKELTKYKDIDSSDKLYSYADARLKPGCNNYLLIDEVQDIPDFQLALRSLHAERKCQIIATGSNAHIFSSELATILGGRYIEIEVYPLSFNEFLIFHNLEATDSSLLQYLRVGGLPGLSLFDIDNERQVNQYLQGVFSTILMKDIIVREKPRNVIFLENLVNFIAENIGKLFSPKKITNTMNSLGEKISDTLTGSYARYLINSLIINEIKRYDIHGRKIFERIQKYYFTDIGIRNLISGFSIGGSIEKLMENAIYNHLRINGYKVYVGDIKNREIDFVAEKGEKKIYIQSTYLLASTETIEREFGNLVAIKDNFPKIVVSMDPVTGGFNDYPGILHMGLKAFLTDFS